jgi:hypothetical protein
MKKRSLAISALMIVLVLVAALAIFLVDKPSSPSPKVESVTPHYLTYNGDASKIYLVGAATSYGSTNETYSTLAGQVVQKGTSLFIVTVTLRNDYTSDNPAPAFPNQNQMSPADGTAYLYLTAQLRNKNGVINATDVSVSDFSMPAIQGTGCVLASGQTSPVNIYIATMHTDISKCEINLVALGDSIPT